MHLIGDHINLIPDQDRGSMDGIAVMAGGDILINWGIDVMTQGIGVIKRGDVASADRIDA